MTAGSNVMRWEDCSVRRDASEAPRRGDASDVEIAVPGRGLQYPGRIERLDGQGCLIQTKCRLESGTVVEVWLRTEGMPLRLAATLVDRSESGVEFKFQAMAARKMDQIEVLRRELGL